MKVHSSVESFASGAFEVTVDMDSIQVSDSSVVTGGLWISLGGIDFPEQDWNDFVVVVLGWWNENILSFLSGDSHKCRCDFMDGPYSFEIKDSASEWVISLIQKDLAISSHSVTANLVLPELIEASNSVISFCDSKKLLTDDLSKLKVTSRRLINTLPRYTS